MEVSERWKSIASRVPGKNKRECVERFKELNQILKQQQQQQQQSGPAELKCQENAAGTLRAEGAARNRSAAGWMCARAVRPMHPAPCAGKASLDAHCLRSGRLLAGQMVLGTGEWEGRLQARRLPPSLPLRAMRRRGGGD